MNLVILNGNLVSDASIKKTKSGKSYCGVSLAVRDDMAKNTVFVPLRLWGTRGEKLAQYLKKGIPVLVTGKINIYKEKTRINITQLEFLARREKTEKVTGIVHEEGMDIDQAIRITEEIGQI